MNIRPRPPFRLLYDFRWMQLGSAGGVEQASYELVSAVSRLDRRNTYRIHAPRSACWEWDLPEGFRATREYSDPREAGGERLHAFIARCMAEAAGGDPTRTAAFRADDSRDVAFDLVHSTASFIHPELVDFPGVLTIQDLQHLHYPEFFEKADWDNRERLYRTSAQRARHIICSSEFTRMDVHRRYGVPLDRMTTIWVIPSAALWDEVDGDARRGVLARLGLRRPFLLYPAQPWPHKNHRRLLEAFALALPRLPGDIELVLTGRPPGPDHPAAPLLASAALSGRVRHLGFRTPLEMRTLFHECTALFFPSLFEGFGMPVAEAMIAGRPVACSNAASLPEIAGDAAITFDAADVATMADVLIEIATRESLRSQLGAAAQRRRRLFSARTTALRTMAVYEKVFAESQA